MATRPETERSSARMTSRAWSLAEVTETLRERPDVEAIADGLQAAIEIELATLPPYMTAYWSIQDLGSKAATLIYDVFKDEMWHFANACNLLTGLKDSKRLPLLVSKAPMFPGALPGGVHPGLRVSLQALTTSQLRTFMELEHPAFDPVARLAGREGGTIGAFYAALIAAIEETKPEFMPGWQLIKGGPEGGASPVSSPAQAADVLRAIATEGEGIDGVPMDPAENDLAHYYVFASLYHQRMLKHHDDEPHWRFDGDQVPLPLAYPISEGTAAAPDYANSPKELKEFDATWTLLLTQLEATYRKDKPDSVAFSKAKAAMYALDALALALVAVSRPDKTGNFAPGFRIL